MLNFCCSFLIILTCFLAVNTGCQRWAISESKASFLNSANQHQPAFSSEKTNMSDDPKVITEIKQLTQVGPRSGEAYFSADGKQLIYQSERYPGNPFYQIYKMDLATGKSDLISNGSGKTTCSWIHPDGSKVLFASTHLDKSFKQKVKEEEELRKSPQKNKYSWSFDENFDIFSKDLKTKKLKNLTSSPGYDAEGSYSPDGQWIVFASNRTGYTEKLSEEDQKLFKQDPSSQMEIYIAKADGSNVKRLTNHLGYDGGPFFSADGKKITWRQFTANGAQAEIWTMNIDGSEQRQLTQLKAMSWAPYYHPSGDYIIFTTNKLGYSNFELYIVDAEGKHDPVRVSYWDGFDGLPVFSPNGEEIVWSHKDEKGESQLYIADWDDGKARDLLGLPQVVPTSTELKQMQSLALSKRIVRYLAQEKTSGRLTGTKQEYDVMNSLSEVFKDLGLKTYLTKSYIHDFKFSSNVELGSNNFLKIKSGAQENKLVIEKDFLPLSFSKTGDYQYSGIAFAGYGMVAAANGSQPEYNSYKDLDVKNKWVLIFREIPEDIENPRRIFLNQVSRLHHKALVAKQAGAIGLLVVSGPRSSSKQKVMKLRFDGSFAEAGLPVISISDDVAESLLKSTGKKLLDWQKELDSGKIVGLSSLENIQIAASVDLKSIESTGHNVLAQIQIPGAKQTLIIGAHGDHLGRGESGSSLAKGNDVGQIHFGADDNASGVAGLILIAREMQHKILTKEFKPKQNIVFAVWSGEELGLLGSSAFLKNENPQNISAYLNMDMIGRLRDQLLVQGAGSALEWREIVEPLAIKNNVSISMQNDPYLPSDSMSFYMKGIASLMFFTGVHTEYHTPQDTWEKINYPGLVTVANFVENLSENLASNQINLIGKKQTSNKVLNLTYQKVESSHQKLEGRSFRVYLGTIPDYAQEKTQGVLISGTSKDSPAEKAGLKAGDIIKNLAGTKIENIYDYVYVLQSLKPNQKIKVEVLRKDQMVSFDIVPALKE